MLPRTGPRPGRSTATATATAALRRARRARRVYTVTYSGTALRGFTIHRVIPRSMGHTSALPQLTAILDAGHDYRGIHATSPGQAVRLLTEELRDQHADELYRLGIEQDDADDDNAVVIALA